MTLHECWPAWPGGAPRLSLPSCAGWVPPCAGPGTSASSGRPWNCMLPWSASAPALCSGIAARA
eukprot:2541599-Alexandrium_andersonii.AAC.1